MVAVIITVMMQGKVNKSYRNLRILIFPQIKVNELLKVVTNQNKLIAN